MKTKTQQSTPTSHEQTEAKAEVIKLGLDIHKKEYVVVQQTDGEAPKSPQRFKPDAFLQWVAKLSERASRIVSCYEGPHHKGFPFQARLDVFDKPVVENCMQVDITE